MFLSLGKAGRRAQSTIAMPAAPNSRRKATRVKGPSSTSASLIQRNDDPQIEPSKKNAPQLLTGIISILL